MWLPLILTIFLCYLAYKALARPPNFPTGPWNLPIVGYAPFLGYRPYMTLKELSKKYGELFSINIGGHRAIVLSSYQLIKDALKEDNFSGRPILPFYELWSARKGLLFSSGYTWIELRRFTLRHLKDLGLGKSTLERVIQAEIQELVLSYKRNIGQPLRLNNTFNIAVLNALWTITTGQRFDLDDPKAMFLVEHLTKIINEGASVRLLEFIPMLNKLNRLPESEISLVNDIKSLLKANVIEHKRVHKEGDTSDFLHVFLNRMQQDERQGLSSPFTGENGMENLLVSTMDLFMAGSETTSTTLLWVFWLLSAYPDAQEKVHQELDTFVGKERMPSMDDKPRLPYTEAVLMECQRYGYMVPLSLVHCCTADTKFKGYVIPKGTLVVPNLYQVLYNPKTWLKPEEFYPGHFLTQDGKVKYVEQFIPFSMGKRICLGEGLAKVELFLFATTLLQQFSFVLAPEQPKPPSTNSHSVIHAPVPYEVILTLRT